jgi:hypothetical protein
MTTKIKKQAQNSEPAFLQMAALMETASFI